MRETGFFAELRRRNVFRVGVAYVLLAWVLLQAADFGLDLIDAPNWVIQALVMLAVIGLPGVLVFSWVFEMTPEGIKRENEVDRSRSITHQTGRKLDRAIIGVLVVALALLAFDRFRDRSGAARGPASTPPGVEAEGGRSLERTAEKSIAVLPFAAMSSGADDGYFADGLTEEILNALAAAVDGRVYGPQSLVLTAYWCACGTPWDLEATPRLKEKLATADLAWPPASPIRFPLKDW